MKSSATRSGNVVFLPIMPKIIKFEATNRIRELRMARTPRMTLQQLAKLIGTSATQLSRLELGERDLDLPWMERIARALGVSVADLHTRDHGGLTPEERRLVETVREVPEGQRKMFYNLMESQQVYRGEPEVHQLHPDRDDDGKANGNDKAA